MDCFEKALSAAWEGSEGAAPVRQVEELLRSPAAAETARAT